MTKLKGIAVLILLFGACTYGPKFVIDETDLRDKSWNNELSEPESLPRLSDSIYHETETVFYSDAEKGIDIVGRQSGIPQGVSKIYITLFTDYGGNLEVQRKFDTLLSQYLSGYGLELMSRIHHAEVVISGSINTFAILPAQVITNMEGSFYQLEVEYKVIESDGNVLQEGRSIEEQLLVADTNTYTTNKVIPYIVDIVAKQTAEAIYYGGQVKTFIVEDEIEILGTEDRDEDD